MVLYRRGVFIAPVLSLRFSAEMKRPKSRFFATTPEPAPQSYRSAGPLVRSGPRSLRMTPSTTQGLSDDGDFPAQEGAKRERLTTVWQ